MSIWLVPRIGVLGAAVATGLASVLHLALTGLCFVMVCVSSCISTEGGIAHGYQSRYLRWAWHCSPDHTSMMCRGCYW